MVKLLAIACLSGVFLVAGVGKLLDPMDFARDMASYEMLPTEVIWFSAWFFIGLEVLVAGVLWWRSWRVSALLLATGLMVVFIGVVSWAYFQGLNVDCGCIAGIEMKTGDHYGWLLLRNGLIVGLCLLVLLHENSVGWRGRDSDSNDGVHSGGHGAVELGSDHGGA